MHIHLNCVWQAVYMTLYGNKNLHYFPPRTSICSNSSERTSAHLNTNFSHFCNLTLVQLCNSSRTYAVLSILRHSDFARLLLLFLLANGGCGLGDDNTWRLRWDPASLGRVIKRPSSDIVGELLQQLLLLRFLSFRLHVCYLHRLLLPPWLWRIMSSSVEIRCETVLFISRSQVVDWLWMRSLPWLLGQEQNNHKNINVNSQVFVLTRIY